MRYKFRHLLLAVTVFALVVNAALPVYAQNPTGSIRGLVTDQQGAVIQNATVTITNKATGDTRKLSTGDDGIYQVSSLLPGDYEVRIEAQGFSTQILSVVVQVGNTTSGDASLRVGAANEIVDVTAEAPLIDKQNYKIDGVITRQKIDALPLNGRNFLQLALLEPGVGVSASNPGAQNNLFNVSIGGAPSALTRLTVDGGSILDPVCGGAAQNFSTESIQEFQISTFNFDLSTGVTSVGSINIVSRTGTNEFHGSAFLFWRNDAFAAVPTLIRPPQGVDLEFERYQYGGAFGGPFKKDRAFFFGNIERLDQEAAIATFVTDRTDRPGLPSLSQFSTITNSPYKGILANLRADVKINDKNNIFGRYSHDNNDVFAPDADNTLPSNWRDNHNNDYNLQGGLTTLFTQNIVNDVRFNFQNIVNDEFIPSTSQCPSSNIGCIGLGGPQIRVADSNIRIGNTVNAPQNRNLKRYQTTDNVSWQKGAHRLRFGGEWEHNYGYGGWAFLDPALIVVHNPSTILGLNLQNAAQINAAPIPAALKQQILAVATLPLPAAFTTPGAQITVQDLLGLPVVAGTSGGTTIPLVGIGDPSQPPNFQGEIARQSNRYRFYAQDSWLVTPGFTFSFGASWQYETNLQNHDLAKPAILQPLIGKLGKPSTDKNNIAPSIGFAWDIGNKGKTVVRGGAGIYYDTVLFVTRLRERAVIGPLGNGRSQVPGAFFRNTIAFPRLNLPGPLAPFNGFNVFNPAIGAPIFFNLIPTKITGQDFMNLLGAQVPQILAQFQTLGSAGVTGVDFFKTGTDLLDPNLEVPYSEQFSVGVQRQVTNDFSVSADFVHRKRVHTLFQNDANLFNRAVVRGGPVIRPCANALEQTDPRVQCSNGPIGLIQSSGRDNYTALLVKADKRFSSRYQFTASYAFSRLNTFFTGEDVTDPFRFYGPSGADTPHRFTFSGVVDMPWGIQGSLIAVYASRGPFNARVSDTIDVDGDGTTGDTLPGLEINTLGRGTSKEELFRLVNEFNARFNQNVVLPRDFDFGDSFQSHDIRLSKSFTFEERYSIQVIGEVFNLFNIANLGGYSSNITSRNFGQPTSRAGQNFGTGGPRAFQFGARFSF